MDKLKMVLFCSHWRKRSRCAMTVSLSERSAGRPRFENFLRSGANASPEALLEAKFHPNHDPKNGRFTFAPGGTGMAPKDRGRPNASAMQQSKLVPFHPHPDEQAIDLEVSNKLNHLVTDKGTRQSVTIASTTLTFQRTGPQTVSVLGFDGHVSLDGRFKVGANQVTFALGQPRLTVWRDSPRLTHSRRT